MKQADGNDPMMSLYMGEVVSLYIHLARSEDQINDGLVRLLDRIRRFLFERLTVEEMEKIESAIAGIAHHSDSSPDRN